MTEGAVSAAQPDWMAPKPDAATGRSKQHLCVRTQRLITTIIVVLSKHMIGVQRITLDYVDASSYSS